MIILGKIINLNLFNKKITKNYFFFNYDIFRKIYSKYKITFFYKILDFFKFFENLQSFLFNI